MALLVDTSVWSLAYRRDTPPALPEVAALREALSSGESVATSGTILLELLRGFLPPKAQATIQAEFAALAFIEPRREDYVAAAGLGNTLRKSGVQLGNADALIAQLAIEHHLVLLTTDRDFTHAAKHIPLKLWTPAAGPDRGHDHL